MRSSSSNPARLSSPGTSVAAAGLLAHLRDESHGSSTELQTSLPGAADRGKPETRLRMTRIGARTTGPAGERISAVLRSERHLFTFVGSDRAQSSGHPTRELPKAIVVRLQAGFAVMAMPRLGSARGRGRLL